MFRKDTKQLAPSGGVYLYYYGTNDGKLIGDVNKLGTCCSE